MRVPARGKLNVSHISARRGARARRAAPRLESKPNYLVEDSQVHQQPMQDVGRDAHIVRPTISVPIERFDVGWQATFPLRSIKRHNKVSQPKV